jgi:hypothetical protein
MAAKLADRWRIVQTPDGPVAYVTTATGFAKQLHRAGDVLEFVATHPWADDLMGAWGQVDPAVRQPPRNLPAATVDQAHAVVAQLAQETH